MEEQQRRDPSPNNKITVYTILMTEKQIVEQK